MKTLLTTLFLLTVVFMSCKKEPIQSYQGDNYIQFSDNVNDSTVHSFLSVPGEKELLIPLHIELVGRPLDEIQEFEITAIDQFSTAEQKHYSLERQYYIDAGKVKDTVYLRGIKTPDLSFSPVKLVLNVSGKNSLRSGQKEYVNKIIYLTNVIAKPNWWDDNVERRLLGSYSDKKYQLFIQLTGVIDVDPKDESLLREYSIIMKNYLLKEKDENRTIYEDNGVEMTVAFIGG